MNILKISKDKSFSLLQFLLVIISFHLIACGSSTKRTNENGNDSLDMKLNTNKLVGTQKNIELTIELSNANKNIVLQNFRLKVTLLEEIGGKDSQISYIDKKGISHAGISLHESLPYFTTSKELTASEHTLKIEFGLLPTKPVKKLSAKFELFDDQAKLIKDCTVVWEAEKIDLELIQTSAQSLKGNEPIQLVIKNQGSLKINDHELKLKVVRKVGSVAVIEESIIQNNEIYVAVGEIGTNNQIKRVLKVSPGTDNRAHFIFQLWYQGNPVGNSVEVIWEKGAWLTIKDVSYDTHTGQIAYKISNQGTEIAKGVKLFYYTNTLQQKLGGKQVLTPIWQEISIESLESGQQTAGQILNKLGFDNGKNTKLIVKLSYRNTDKIISFGQQEIYFEPSSIIDGKISGKIAEASQDKAPDAADYTTSTANGQVPMQANDSLKYNNSAPTLSNSTPLPFPTSTSITGDNTQRDTFSLAGEKISAANEQELAQLNDSLKDNNSPPTLDSTPLTTDKLNRDTSTLAGKNTSTVAAPVYTQLDGKSELIESVIEELSSRMALQFTTKDALKENDVNKTPAISSSKIETAIDEKIINRAKEKIGLLETDIVESQEDSFTVDYSYFIIPISQAISLKLQGKEPIEIELNFKGKIDTVDHSFEDKEIGIVEITNSGNLPINTKNIHIRLFNTKGIHFKLGNRAANSRISTTLNKFLTNSELQPGESIIIQLQLHSNGAQVETFMANLTLELFDEQQNILIKENLVWLNRHHKLYKSVKKFARIIEKYKKEFDEIVKKAETNFKAACEQHHSNTKNKKHLEEWKSTLKSVMLQLEAFCQLKKQYEIGINLALQELNTQIGSYNTKGRLFTIRSFIDTAKVNADNFILESKQFYLFNLENTKNWIIYINKLIEHRVQTELMKVNVDDRIETIKNAAHSVVAPRNPSTPITAQSPLILRIELVEWLNHLIKLASDVEEQNINTAAENFDNTFIDAVRRYVKVASDAENAANLCIEKAKDSIAESFFKYILKAEKQIKSEADNTKVAKLYQLIAEAYQFLAEFDYALLNLAALIQDVKAAHNAAIQASDAAKKISKNKAENSEANQAARAAYSATIAIYKYLKSAFDIYEMKKKETPADYYDISLKYIKDTIQTLSEIRDEYLNSKDLDE
ncbi:hypothetical protein Aasi_0860 [Candidatus Amoebophilus asiaticus 5a2]|uniref:Uncharacterized protein n=1 Tax=Amoebophilus asiaticus (strain 5a2) TaxID=452471 RepID=B3ESM7_AMOA5|nr:sel1 repeat family protein [Candidatus Amoebophilus asiaticus]ACE06229.1 hypothetical protein Aasi_0860 [Candidatus Amoebophilus asiaticus 5a2]